MLHASNTEPTGIWGDATTLYVGNPESTAFTSQSRVYTYNRADQSHASTIKLEDLTDWRADAKAPQGIWSDGTHLWVADEENGYLEAVAFKADPPTYNADESFLFNERGATDTFGLWGNSSVIWVSYDDLNPGQDGIFAYNKGDKGRSSDNDIDLDDDNADPRGIWSDGATMWVIDPDDDKAYAYVLTTGTTFGDRDTEQEFDLPPDNGNPLGIWSDGDTVWVSDWNDGKIYAYYLPGGSSGPRVTAVSAKSTGRETATATVEVDEDTDATVYLRHRLTSETAWNATLSGATSGTGTPVGIDLTGLTPNATYDLEASLDGTFMDGTEVSGVFTNRPAGDDFDMLHTSNTEPTGIWGDATTLYVGNPGDTKEAAKVFTYNRDDQAHAGTIAVGGLSGWTGGTSSPQGIWSDGTYLWVADPGGGDVDAVNFKADPPTHNADESFSFSDVASGSDTYGLWGNSSIIWVAWDDTFYISNRIYAFGKGDKKIGHSLSLDGSNAIPRGIWSDGTTMWVIDADDNKAYAYVLSAGATFGDRDQEQEFNLDPANTSPVGIWSDGDTVWVSDQTGGKLYAYYLPLGEPGLTAVSAKSTGRNTATATVEVENPDSAMLSVNLRHRLTTETTWTNATAQVTAGISAAFDLTGLTPNATYDLEASLDSTFMDGTEVGASFTNRPVDRDFATLHADNDGPKGLSSDGTTMWVVDNGEDHIYGYNLGDKAYNSGKSFGLDTDNHSPRGITNSDGTMWVINDSPKKAFAHNVGTTGTFGSMLTAKEWALDTDNDVPEGAWNDGDTVWVVDRTDRKLYAYDFVTGSTVVARDATKDVSLIADNNFPEGVWSDGTVFWVSDRTDTYIYAYGLDGTRLESSEFDLSSDNGHPRGIWSDGDTLWVADGDADKIYAYYQPPSEPGVTGVSVDSASISTSGATVEVTLNNPDSESLMMHLRYWDTSGSPPASANYTVTTTGTSATVPLSGLSQGVEYQVDASLESDFSEGVASAKFTTLDVAGKPTGVTVTKDDKKLTVAWTAPTDTGGTAITGYKVQWKSGNQNFGSSRQHTAGAAATSDDITGLTNGTEYTVRVLATNSVGDGAWSDEKKGTPSTVPGKPVVTPSAGNTVINVSWTIDTGGSAITGYTLQYKDSSVAGWAAADVTEVNPANDQTSYKIENLTNGTAYTVRVQATNANGTGVWSDEEQSTPVAGPSVTDVETEDLAKTSAKVVVTIANPQSTSETVHMRYKKTADANWSTARTLSTMGTEVKFPLTGLSGGTEYQAQASLDGTFATGVVSHTFTTLNEPGAPTGVTVTKDDKKLTVAWTAPTDTGGTDITGYKVQWKSGNQGFNVSRQHTAGASATSYDITGLTNGTEYTVRVLATNSVGDGAWSDEKKGTPSTVPGKPSVDVSAGNGLLQVRWTVDDGGAAITGHTLQYKLSSVTGWATADVTEVDKAADQTSHTITGLTNGTDYTVRLQATNANGTGAWSDVERGTPTAKPPPSVTIATEESEPIRGPFTFTVTFNEEVEDFHCYEDEPENPPDGPRCEIGAGYVGGALVDVRDFQEVEVNSAGEHVFSARVEDILTGTLAIFVNEGKARAKAGGLGNTFGALQVEVERPVLPDTPGVNFWSANLTPAAIGGYLGYGSVGSPTGGSLSDDEFEWPRPGQTYTVKALLYNPAQGQVMLDLSHALPNRGERMILAVDGKWVSDSNPEQSGVNEGGEAWWTYHWHPADPGFEAGQSVDVRLSRQAPNILVTREYAAMSWDDPEDDSITGYRIERRDRDQGGGFRTLVADTGSADTGYTDRSVEPGGRYAYQVTALNDYGESDPSGPVEVEIPGGPPDRPTGLGATASEEAVTLSWDDPQDDGITGYRIERQDREGGDGFATLEADTGNADTGYTDGTVEAGGSYAYRVSAINGDGESPPSAAANADVPGGNPSGGQAPAKPTGLNAVASGGNVVLTWANPNDDGITGYRIWRRNRDRDPAGQFSVLVDDTHSDATMFTDRGVKPDTRYAYRIAAVNDAGESQWSGSARVRTPPAPVHRDG